MKKSDQYAELMEAVEAVFRDEIERAYAGYKAKMKQAVDDRTAEVIIKIRPGRSTLGYLEAGDKRFLFYKREDITSGQK